MSNETTKTERDQTIKLDVSAKVYPVKDPKQEKGSILAFASADIGGCFAVTGIKIVEGKEGPFVAMPSQFGKDKQHHDIPTEYHAAVEKWLDATYAGLYAVKQEHGPEIAAQVAGLSCQRCALYPGEMLPAAVVLKNGGDAEQISGMMASGTLEMDEPFFLDLPDGAALTRQGPEINIARSGVPCGLVQRRTEPGYLLADGIALLESERDSFGRYRGGAGTGCTFRPGSCTPLCAAWTEKSGRSRR